MLSESGGPTPESKAFHLLTGAGDNPADRRGKLVSVFKGSAADPDLPADFVREQPKLQSQMPIGRGRTAEVWVESEGQVFLLPLHENTCWLLNITESAKVSAYDTSTWVD